jgi:tRNA nucleotidyltransferase/poly(A) polymerase
MSLLEKIDPDLLAGTLHICTTLRDRGFQSLVAGGAVRDLLLNKPVSEIDIATSAPPEEVQRLFPRTVAVGKQFGVIIVVEGGKNYEVTTFRRESGYLDGRHPTQIHFTDAREDALRRDFTVNALFLDPFTGQFFDFVGGQADLEKRLIRTVGDPAERFGEDKLRVLRAVRFACQLGFRIEAETFRQVQRSASGLTLVSWERIRDEILKILTGPDPARGLVLLDESGILPVILPEVAAMKGVEQPPEFHPEGDVFEHTRLMLSLAGGLLDPVLAMAILLHDVGKPPTFTVKERIRFDGHAELGAEMADAICRRLRLTTEQTEEIVDLVKNHLRFIPVQEMRESTLKRFLRKENFHRHLELHRLDCLASHGDLSSYNFCRRKLEEFTLEALRPKPLIGGQDLIDLGLEPGPIFSEILGSVEDLQLEGKIKTREEALDWVRRRHPGR